MHPDLHSGDPRVEQRLRDVIRAYETLGNPQSRTAYDAKIASLRSQRRRRDLIQAATTATTFALTVWGVFAVMQWRELDGGLARTRRPGGPSGQETRVVVSGKAEGVATPTQVASRQEVKNGSSRSERPSTRPSGVKTDPTPDNLIDADEHDRERASCDVCGGGRASEYSHSRAVPRWTGCRPSKPERWINYRNTRFGFSLEYPADVFVTDAGNSDDGKSLLSGDGRARFFVSAKLNTSGATIVQHRQSLLDGPYRDAAFDYAPRRPNWFVLSGTLGTEMFYERVTFSCDGRALHGWKMVYPILERSSTTASSRRCTVDMDLETAPGGAAVIMGPNHPGRMMITRYHGGLCCP